MMQMTAIHIKGYFFSWETKKKKKKNGLFIIWKYLWRCGMESSYMFLLSFIFHCAICHMPTNVLPLCQVHIVFASDKCVLCVCVSKPLDICIFLNHCDYNFLWDYLLSDAIVLIWHRPCHYYAIPFVLCISHWNPQTHTNCCCCFIYLCSHFTVYY